MARINIIGGPASANLSKRIAERLDAKYIGCELRVFPDGEGKITFSEKPSGISVVVQSLCPPVDSNLIRCISIVSQAAKNSDRVVVVMPYMGYARQDREFLPGEVVTSAVVADMLNAAGAAGAVVVDIHSSIALDNFKIPIKNVSAVGELAKYFKGLKLKDPVAVSPDAGGVERTTNFADLLGAELAVFEKRRDRKTGDLSMRIGKGGPDVSGRDVVIVDDMISGGGTTAKAAQLLRDSGCGRIYASCTHALLIGDARDRITKSGVSRIVSTNTIEGETGIVDVSGIIAKELQIIL